VIGLTEPWHGQLSPAGVGFAAAAALGWGGYILLTQRVGAQLHGLQGLAMSLGTATAVAAPVAAPAALHGLTPGIAVQGIGLAMLVPLLPFTFELLASRRMRIAAFGTLMALEPAIATMIGLILLDQLPQIWPIAGVALVVTAGIGAQRTLPVAEVKPAVGCADQLTISPAPRPTRTPGRRPKSINDPPLRQAVQRRSQGDDLLDPCSSVLIH
jgi:inner membrane transporter RhtA